MSLVEIRKGFMNAKLPKQEVQTADISWEDAIYVPESFSAGMCEIRSGKLIGPEIRYCEVQLILEGEAEIKERKTGETYAVKKGDAVLIRKGAKVTITAKTPMKFWYITVPPHSELAEVYSEDRE